MKKVLLVSSKGVGERTAFAKNFFDEMNKLAALFMMYTHGVGRWPSSRTPLMDCTTTKRLTKKQCDNADYIIVLDSNPPEARTTERLRASSFCPSFRTFNPVTH